MTDIRELQKGSFIEFNQNSCYVIEQKLGSGYSSTVYQVQCLETNEELALKIGYKNKNIKSDQLINEINIYRHIENYVTEEDMQYFGRLVDKYEDDKYVCIILKLYKNDIYKSIESRSYKGLPLQDVQKILRDLATGLNILHSINIIHCDLKPENMIDADDGIIKIIDFGSAFIEEKNIYGTVQTLYYRAPEVFLKCKLTSAIDIWSFGCIAFELFAGYPLFYGKDDLDMLKFIQVRLGKFPFRLIHRSKVVKIFFDSDGNVKNIENFKDRLNKGTASLEQLIYSISGIDSMVVSYFYDLVKICLTFDAEKRAKSKDVVNHPFLNYEFN